MDFSYCLVIIFKIENLRMDFQERVILLHKLRIKEIEDLSGLKFNLEDGQIKKSQFQISIATP